LTIAELENELKKRNARLSGRKKIIIERFVDYMKCKLIVYCQHQSRWVENESRKSNEICQANAVNSMKRTVL
jgi:hypothetical protein